MPLIAMATEQVLTPAKITAETKISDLTVGQLQNIIQSEVKKCFKIVDPYPVIQGSLEWQEKEASMRTAMETQQKELEKMAMEGERKKNELRTMANTLKKEAREAKELELFRIENDIKVKQQQAQRGLQEMYETTQMELYKQLGDITKEIAQEQGVLVVQAGGILYADPAVDISNTIVERANQKYTSAKKATENKPVMAQNNKDNQQKANAPVIAQNKSENPKANTQKS